MRIQKKKTPAPYNLSKGPCFRQCVITIVSFGIIRGGQSSAKSSRCKQLFIPPIMSSVWLVTVAPNRLKTIA